jgi:CheY-like chemotaxis protein
LADDSTHAQRMGAKILTAEGHEVTTVSNGQAAIHSIEEAVPDLVVADVFMPGRNGYEVSRFIKTSDKLKNIPVLLIIGAMEPYDPEEGKRAGADGLITKPLESSNLVATVKDLLTAATRFAPTRAKVSRKGAAAEDVEEAPADEVVETPAWEEEEEEVPVEPEQKLEIPKEMSQQPIGMLTDYMDAPEPAEPPPMVMDDLMAAPMEVAEAVPAEMAEPQSLLPDPSTVPQLDIAEKTVWTAEPAPMTPEEEKLFEQPSADWGDLAQLVEQGDAEVETAEMVPPEAEPEPLPVEMESIPAPSPMEDPGIEHFESLDSVVAAAPMTAPTSGMPMQGMEVPSMASEPEPLMEELSSEAEELSSPQTLPAVVEPVEEITAAPSERNMPPMEQLVRQAVEDLMPEIVERVKQFLKS